MKFKSNLLAFLLFAGITSISFSQSNTKTDVNKDIDVVRVYEQVVQEGYGTPFIYKNLANAYYFRNEYNQALIWFEKLFEAEKNTDPEIAQRYQQTLKAIKANKNSAAVVKI
ncbi:hypothetical protein A7A78_11950 [Aequorivita soesokkakensis]|jgi:tetratricopeptide (TPR) repeat protein|uniref:Uncharacterized protein n=1 Tax=Aequorivita soesokkakensis TaxID=1385699 RepID=A0A1A9LDT3_9FLAO|nr:hypothetical protein [Aequorivita soesokkakensis]OAD91363.1 hypothetical protein A7A78_11950 [Aequorivita soesokkakensis]